MARSNVRLKPDLQIGSGRGKATQPRSNVRLKPDLRIGGGRGEDGAGAIECQAKA